MVSSDTLILASHGVEVSSVATIATPPEQYFINIDGNGRAF
jgi:hypothetical protein